MSQINWCDRHVKELGYIGSTGCAFFTLYHSFYIDYFLREQEYLGASIAFAVTSLGFCGFFLSFSNLLNIIKEKENLV